MTDDGTDGQRTDDDGTDDGTDGQRTDDDGTDDGTNDGTDGRTDRGRRRRDTTGHDGTRRDTTRHDGTDGENIQYLAKSKSLDTLPLGTVTH